MEGKTIVLTTISGHVNGYHFYKVTYILYEIYKLNMKYI